MLGQDVVAAAPGFAAALARGDLDVTDAGAVRAAVTDARPDVIINCAAFTDVDGCEEREEEATAVNGTGAGNVAAAAASAGALVVHVSSDYVFDGTKGIPYVESDSVGPLSAYGRSKLAGEEAIRAAAPDHHLIVRSSWLFGAGGRNFVTTIAGLAAERDELSVVTDQVGCPTFTGHLAHGLIACAEAGRRGTAHLAGGGRCSWNEFAQEIVRSTGSACRVLPSTTAEMARPAPRPAFSAMESERGDLATLPPWREGLRAFLAAGASAPAAAATR
jgi:dTDP-4-dehydrorhamnose reductase